MSDDPVDRFGGAATAPDVSPGPAESGDSPPAAPESAGELLTPQQLRERARELAQLHAVAPRSAAARPLLEEVERAARALGEAYRVLLAAAETGRDLVPAEEWLVDNFHVVEDQIREVREDLSPGYYAELPRLGEGRFAGYPRVYAAAQEYIEHTDAQLDRDSLLDFVRAYQEVDPLSIGELWAVPIMLRVGLLLNLRRLAGRALEQRAVRERADGWAERLAERARRRPADAVVGVAELATSGEELSPVFLVWLVRRLRDQDVPLGAALDWVDQIAAESGATAADLARQQQHRQAADQVSVGNSITAMRQIAALSWVEFFERASRVDEILRTDPADAYAAMEPASRDDYRRRVERLAERTGSSEIAVARAAVARARAGAEAGGAGRQAHVGYYLVGDGRRSLEEQVGYRPPPDERVRRLLRAHPTFTYLGTIGLLEALAVLGLVAAVGPLDPLRAGLLALLLALPCSEIAVSLANWFATVDFRPRLLPKLDFRDGLPADCRTMVVVPTLLPDAPSLERLLADLEVRYLANQDAHLHFALLTDFPDAEFEEQPGEAELLRAAADGIAALNARHGQGRTDRFYLFHRRRLWNPAQGAWMGWERKRGKLEEFNRLLRGGAGTSFSVQVGDPEVLPAVRYVITLDSDTRLPREVARRLVGAIAHPLQRAELDPELGCVTRGYAIIQPRASTTLTSSGRSLFARIFTGNTGLDPYTTAVSDVYQDLFGEASY
jgi:cyclic beta-1,2-glucan synthetase